MSMFWLISITKIEILEKLQICAGENLSANVSPDATLLSFTSVVYAFATCLIYLISVHNTSLKRGTCLWHLFYSLWRCRNKT